MRTLWRTLVRVTFVDDDRTFMSAILPAWSVRQEVNIPLSDVPHFIMETVEVGKRYFVRADTGTDSAYELVKSIPESSWEL